MKKTNLKIGFWVFIFNLNPCESGAEEKKRLLKTTCDMENTLGGPHAPFSELSAMRPQLRGEFVMNYSNSADTMAYLAFCLKK